MPDCVLDNYVIVDMAAVILFSESDEIFLGYFYAFYFIFMNKK